MTRPEMLRSVETVSDDDRGQDPLLARRHAVRARSRHRGLPVHLEHLHLRAPTASTASRRRRTIPTTIDYFRKSVRETVLTYPLLAGMGITAGEEMRDRKDEFAKEPWLWKTYGEGIRDALKLQPGRDFRLIHRYHQTALPPILEAFKPYPSLVRLELQILGGAHALVARAAVRQGVARGVAGQPAHVDDRAQRRHLQFPLGRP